MKTKASSLFKRTVEKRLKMFQSEIDRILRLIALIKQFNRIKYSHNQMIVPQANLDVVNLLEALLPVENRTDNYVDLELRAPTLECLGDFIVSLLWRTTNKTISNEVKTKLISVDSSIFEPSDISDVSSNEAVDSPPQEPPDVDEPNKKKVKN